MANYTIIGGDNKQYGPVTGEEIRQWIAEGRLDGNSQVRSENDTEWRSLSAFPEFAPSFQARSPIPPTISSPSFSHGTLTSTGIQEVKNPAIALIVIGSLSVLWALWGLLSAIIQSPDLDQSLNQFMTSMSQVYTADQMSQMKKELSDPQVQNLLHLATNKGMRIGTGVFSLTMSALVLLGAVRMLAGRNYEFACVAAILAMIPCLTPCPCCLLGLPIGIWALIALRKPGVKGQFH